MTAHDDGGRGRIDLDDLQMAVASGAVDTVICAFPDLYGRLMGKRLDASFFVAHIDEGAHACDYLLTVDMEMEPIDGYEFASWMQGYGDVRLVPDLTTARVLSWLDRTAFVMCDLQAHDGAPVEVAPRTMLRRQV